MTDKQIIIDGVDVVECPHRKKEVTFMNVIKCYNYGACEGVNCLYKQLARKEQECEELQNKFLELNCKAYSNSLELDQLKAEKDGLKTMLKDLSYENQKFCYQIEEQTKQLEPFKDEYFKGLDNVAIAKLAKKSIRITAENSKLEQTLIEIKEIAETATKYLYATKSDDYADGYRWLGNKILQKISECEVKNENIRNL